MDIKQISDYIRDNEFTNHSHCEELKTILEKHAWCLKKELFGKVYDTKFIKALKKLTIGLIHSGLLKGGTPNILSKDSEINRMLNDLIAEYIKEVNHIFDFNIEKSIDLKGKCVIELNKI
ncbi:hypothetical protein ACI3ER_11625 [Bacillus sp. Wb]